MAGMIVRKHRSDRLQKFAARLTNKQQSVRGRVQNLCQRPVQSSVPPLISSFDFFKVSVRPKRTSPTSSLTPQYQSTVRPKTRISLQKSLSLVLRKPRISHDKCPFKIPGGSLWNRVGNPLLVDEYSRANIHSLGDPWSSSFYLLCFWFTL